MDFAPSGTTVYVSLAVSSLPKVKVILFLSNLISVGSVLTGVEGKTPGDCEELVDGDVDAEVEGLGFVGTGLGDQDGFAVSSGFIETLGLTLSILVSPVPTSPFLSVATILISVLFSTDKTEFGMFNVNSLELGLPT